MTEAIKLRVVHESEAERQYPRVKVPGFITISTTAGQKVFELRDVSAGGLGFVVDSDLLVAGKEYQAQLSTTLSGVEYRIKTAITLVHVDARKGFAGAHFQDIGRRELSALHLIINSYLCGDTLEPGDMINATTRDNFVKQRKKKKDDPGKLGFKAFFGTVFFGLIGLLALAVVAYQIYNQYLVDRSTTASISVDTLDVVMPRDGVFRSLIPEGENFVKSGQPIATYEVSALSFVDQETLSDASVINNLSSLANTGFSGTLFSPCDCIIKEVNALQGNQVSRGSTVITLVPEQAAPMVQAKFRFQDAAHLAKGKTVKLEVIGELKQLGGVISDYRMAENLLDSEGTRGVDVWVKPDQPLPLDWVNRPVQVVVSRL